MMSCISRLHILLHYIYPLHSRLRYMSRKAKRTQNSKNVTIRLNTHELIMMNRASSKLGLSIGKLVKLAIHQNYSENRESDLPKRIAELELLLDDMENKQANILAALLGIKRAFSQMEEELGYLDNLGLVY